VTTIPKMPSHLRELLPLRRREDYKVTTNDNMTLFEIDFFPRTTEDNAVIDYIIALLNAQADDAQATKAEAEQPSAPRGLRLQPSNETPLPWRHHDAVFYAANGVRVGDTIGAATKIASDKQNAAFVMAAIEAYTQGATPAPAESALQPASDDSEARTLIRRLCDAVESVLAAHGTYAPNLTAYRDAIAYLDR
jgi:hypothetical protein